MKRSMMWFVGIMGFFATEAYAVPITFTDTTLFTASDAIDSVTGTTDLDGYGRGDVNFLDGALDYVSWTHHYDFVPTLDHVISGMLSLSFTDNDPDRTLRTKEFAFGIAEDGTWAFGEVDTSVYTFDLSASFLADGMFSVAVLSALGDFFINSSVLTITYEPTSISVPEPSTVAIMGLGLVFLGLIRFSRRRT